MTTLEMTKMQPPLRIMQIMHGAWALEAFMTAFRLDFFSPLSREPLTAAELAVELQADVKATELLLNALLALELIERNGERFSVVEASKPYLDKESPLYMGDYLLMDGVKDGWMQLPDSIKTGKPYCKINQTEGAEKFFPSLAAAIFPMNFCTAHTLATELKVEQMPAGSHVLDIAAGSGVWSIPFAERNKNIRVDALDFPGVLEVTKRFAAKSNVESQYSYISGNWSDCKLESDKYDVVLLGHILHSEGKERSEALIKEVYRSLKKGGKIVIAEMISNNERSGPPFAQLFAINMFLFTEQGCVFTEAELEQMLTDCGFTALTRPNSKYWGPESPVIYATK